MLLVLPPQVYALLPPSADNLAAFMAWASESQHLPVLLAEHAQGALRVEVPAGATLLIPGATNPASARGLALQHAAHAEAQEERANAVGHLCHAHPGDEWKKPP